MLQVLADLHWCQRSQQGLADRKAILEYVHPYARAVSWSFQARMPSFCTLLVFSES